MQRALNPFILLPFFSCTSPYTPSYTPCVLESTFSFSARGNEGLPPTIKAARCGMTIFGTRNFGLNALLMHIPPSIELCRFKCRELLTWIIGSRERASILIQCLPVTRKILNNQFISNSIHKLFEKHSFQIGKPLPVSNTLTNLSHIYSLQAHCSRLPNYTTTGNIPAAIKIQSAESRSRL